jgi:hypothetical protein
MSTYADLYVDVGTDYEGIVNLGTRLRDDYDFFGVMKKTLTAPVAAEFAFTIVPNQPNKLKIKLSSVVTPNLKPGRYFYDIFGRNRNTSDIVKIQEGQVHVSPAITTVISEEET